MRGTRYSWKILIKSELSGKIIEKNKSNFMKIRPLAAQLSTRGQDVTVAFRNFANAPENVYD
jgi:hypothetical protein